MVSSNIHNAADAHVLDCHAVAMQEDDRAAPSPLNVVQANAVAGDERPAWRICLLSSSRLAIDDCCTACQGKCPEGDQSTNLTLSGSAYVEEDDVPLSASLSLVACVAPRRSIRREFAKTVGITENNGSKRLNVPRGLSRGES